MSHDGQIIDTYCQRKIIDRFSHQKLHVGESVTERERSCLAYPLAFPANHHLRYHQTFMCGRFQLQISSTLLAAAHRNTVWSPGHEPRHIPRQEVRPTTTAPVLVGRPLTPHFHAASKSEPQPVPCELVVMKVSPHQLHAQFTQ